MSTKIIILFVAIAMALQGCKKDSGANSSGNIQYKIVFESIRDLGWVSSGHTVGGQAILVSNTNVPELDTMNYSKLTVEERYDVNSSWQEISNYPDLQSAIASYVRKDIFTVTFGSTTTIHVYNFGGLTGTISLRIRALRPI